MIEVIESSTRKADAFKTIFLFVTGLMIAFIAFYFSFNYWIIVFICACSFSSLCILIGAREIIHPNTIKIETNGSWFSIVMNNNEICSGQLQDVAGMVTLRHDIAVKDMDGDYNYKLSRKRIIMKNKVFYDLPIQFNDIANKFESYIIES